MLERTVIMDQKIKMVSLGTAQDGREIRLFRIPNSTNDYIELSTRGCALKGICLHAPDGSMENILAEHADGRAEEGILEVQEAGSGHPAVLPETVWNVAEVGENHVFLTCRADGGNGEIALGARIMWVNRNRLVADLFVTPEREAALDIRSSLLFRNAGGEACLLRTFCPRYRAGDGWQSVEGSVYGDLRFQPLTGDVDFSAPEESEVRPVMEVTGTAERLAISVYGNLPVARAAVRREGVQITQGFAEPVVLQGGQTCYGRVIFGFDRLSPEKEAAEPDAGPFNVFL